jgi:hypothetical protein
MEREALKLALEALDALCLNDYSGYELGKRDSHLVDNAITAIKAALAQPVQEPDALTIAYQSGFYDGKKAAQREWVGLTEDEMLAVVHYSQLDNARAIEAKLRERNS